MNIISIIIILVVVVASLGFFIYQLNFSKTKKTNRRTDPYGRSIDEAVSSIFDANFREELKNRGKLYFEKVLNDNAMFLKQDLELTNSEIHDYLKQEIDKNLESEFKNYKDTIEDAKKLAIESIKKTQTVLEDQRKNLTAEIVKQFDAEKKVLVSNFQDNMAEIINHYLLKAVGGHINLNDQLEFIIADLETNKAAIVEDINEGS